LKSYREEEKKTSRGARRGAEEYKRKNKREEGKKKEAERLPSFVLPSASSAPLREEFLLFFLKERR